MNIIVDEGNTADPGVPIKPGDPGELPVPITPGDPGDQPPMPIDPDPGDPGDNPSPVDPNPGDPGDEPPLPIDPKPGDPGENPLPVDPTPGEPGDPADPTPPPPSSPDYDLKTEEFYYNLPSGKLGMLFIVDDSETMEGIHADIKTKSQSFENAFLQQDLSHLTYKIGFLRANSPTLLSLEGKSLLEQNSDLEKIPDYMNLFGFAGLPRLNLFQTLIDHYSNSKDFKNREAFSFSTFVASDDFPADMTAKSFVSQNNQQHPAYLNAFAALHRTTEAACTYRDAAISEKLVSLENEHMYVHPFEICDLKTSDYFTDIANTALNYTKRIILRDVPFKISSIQVSYLGQKLLPSEFGFDAPKNEVLIQTASIPLGGKLVVSYWIPKK